MGNDIRYYRNFNTNEDNLLEKLPNLEFRDVNSIVKFLFLELIANPDFSLIISQGIIEILKFKSLTIRLMILNC